MENFEELLLKEEFNRVEVEVKKLLDKDNNNSKLWYILFLAQNNNYINFNKSNIKNELAFNKAIEYASLKEEMKYKFEYTFYSKIGLLKNYSKLFRLYQFKEYDKCIELVSRICLSNDKVNLVDDDIIFLLDHILGKYNTILELDLSIVILNLLFISTNNININKLINNLLNSDFIDKSSLYPFKICVSFNELASHLGAIKFNKTFEYDENINENDLYIKELLFENKYDKSLDNVNIKKAVDSYYNKEYNTAYNIILDELNKGNLEANAYLAFLLFNGFGVKKNVDKALFIYKEEAKKNNIVSILNLGAIYEYGINVDKNNIVSYEYYLTGSGLQNPIAARKFALCYLNGIGVNVDKDIAFNLMLRAKEYDDKIATYYIGYMYLYGYGTSKNYQKAFEYFDEAKDDMVIEGMRGLAYMYFNGLYVEKNIEKAFKYYEIAANNGDIESLYKLATFYEYGNICDRDIDKAILYYDKAAKFGHIDSKVRLAYVYINSGVGTNIKNSIQMLIDAANMNCVDAMIYLGSLYSSGVSVNKDDKEAFNWYLKAANLNNKVAINEVSKMYFEGRGTPRNLKKALEWKEKLKNMK